MLMPDPKDVRALLSRYAAARLAHEERETLKTATQLDDVSYTLCVATATTEINDALAAADRLLAQPPPSARSRPGGCKP
ncbi:DUF5133 domain-containing protein [Streptomyces decoyicus]|uniref:DUF5133 domain-containing protein n=1 Tax=Streptomyces decoyicus TaxID=249567 RepID=A0ABZ1F8W9_9ACTN|nr:DUF5133 domain-containing protein [Streptomyces decoyicus]WSB66651.1 DUF5133 domain-containing protein [Streptomyces decoyicus]